ncbi:apolipophorins-like [Mercenaria mercenaria]|uniref:apolipophorins-like n=1 Tax=Mercenaria mercenaria TaxID=6596 RepID=UPI00234F7574|nr:apolipophorins-like [Mercenaria mercenaria]
MEYRLAILLALTASSFAGPARQRSLGTGSSSCSKSCTGSTKFGYAPGSTYQYKYEGETRTSMLGASEDHSAIWINALVDIEVISKCEFILQVNDVTIFAYDSKQFADQDKDKQFAQTLEKYPLRFSFQDGRIESVCPAEKEEAWAVNIKKGILSSLQNSMDSFDFNHKGSESDVTGKCDTEYTVAQRGWRTLSIKKSKDLSSCSHRQGFSSAVQTTPFRVSSGIKSLPIMKETHTCDQEVSTAGVLTSSVCHEMHTLRPFSKENSGATTEVTQKMTFVQERKGTSHDQAECGAQEELYFEHAPSDIVTDLSAREAIDLLLDLCHTTATEVTPTTSHQFSTLVSTMKRIDFAGLRRVYNQMMEDNFCRDNQERVRRFYVDAIPMVGTEASIQLMKTLISNSDITGTQADVWLASIAFIQHPTKQMIQYVQELIGLPTLSSKVLLPLSAMVQSYCQVNPLCGEVKEITDFIDILQRNIGGGCKADQKNFQMIMMTLRALGNTGHAEMAVPALYTCIEGDNSMDIKVAAIQAFRKLSCASDRNNLMGIYRDTTADSELRINAYLAVMKCPSSYFISQIQDTLAAEEVNQVGSFVWSHLTNLMESSDPSNRYVQELLTDAEFDQKFDLDKMKFSRNYEGSFYLEKYNTGAKIDSNLIWSSRSFVPRSANLNLTMNLFGESMNLFEIGGRVEGLESLMESYFGPVGYYNDETKGSNEIPDADPTSAGLSKRKLNDIRSKAKKTVDELRGAMYMRMFGSEVSYTMFGANNGNSDDKFAGSLLFDFLQKLRNNEKQELSLTRNVMLLDSTYTLPTIVGLPLRLAVNGSATVALNVGGQVNLKNPRQSVVIEGNFEPSGSVEIDSVMSVDAVVTRGGLKMVSTLYTSTGAQGKIEVTGGNIFDFTFDITRDKSEIIDVKTSFFFVYNDYEKEQNMIKDGQEEKSACTGDRLTRVAGVQFCASYSAPNASSKPDAPYFPFTGPVSFSVAMSKQDLPNGYKLEVKTIKTPIQTLFRFLSDTPGSKNDRAIGLDVDVKHSDKTLDIILVSPWKKATVKGELIDTATVKGLLGNIDIDEGQRIYNLDAKILIDRTKDRVTYTPQISLDISDWKKVSLTGGINYKLKTSFDADLLITGAQDAPIVIQSSILNTDTVVGMKGKFNYEKGEGYVFEAISKRKIERKRLRSRYTYEPRVYLRTPDEEILEFNGSAILITGKSFKATGSLEKLTKIPFKFNVDLSNTEHTKKKRMKSMGRVTVTGPRLSNKLMIMHDNRGGKNIFTKYRWDYSFGKQWRDTIMGNNRVKINTAKNKKNVKITSSLNSVKNDNLDANLVVNYATNRYKTNLDLNLKYGKNLKSKTTKETVDLSVAAKHSNERVVEYQVDLKFPAKDVDVTITGDNKYQDKSVQSNIKIQYHPERSVAFGVHLHNRTDLYPNYAGELSIKLPQNRELSFAGAFGKENDNKYISNLEFEIIKGRRTRIDTVLKIATQKMYEFEVGVKLPELEPVRALGSYIREENGHTVEASYKKGDNLYRIFVQGICEPSKNAKFLFEVTVPSRKVKVNVGSSLVDTERHMLFDVQWNADKSLDDRFLTNMTYDFKSWDDFEVAYLLHYPSRTIGFNMKHSAAARYITNIELSWSPKEKLEFNIIFRNDKFNGDDRTELSVEFISPFERFEELGLAVSLIRDSTQYQTKTSVTWDKKKKVIVSATAKVPFEVNSIDIAGTISTPFKNYKSLAANLKHRLDDDLQTIVLVEWGRNRLSLKTSGELKYTKMSRSFNGKIDFRSPFEGLRVLILNAEHQDDSKKFSSKITTDVSHYSSQVNMDTYNIEMDMTHDNTLSGLKNQGTLNILIPNDDISTVWEVSRLTGSSRVMVDVTPMRGNRFKFDFGETHQLAPNRKLRSTFEFLIPTETLRELLISFNHEDKPGFVKTSGSVTKDNLEMMSADVNYQNSYGTLKLDSLIKSIYTEDLILKLTSAHSIMPYNSNFELKWGETPYKINAESNIFYNEFGMFDNSLKILTPIPRFNMFTITTLRERQGLNWRTKTEVNVDGQKVSLAAVYRFDHVKQTEVSIKSSFPQFPGLDTSFKIDGNPVNFKGSAAFVMKPYVDKISTDFSWAFYLGTSLTGTFNLYTPFRQYPYMKAKVNSNTLGMSRVSGFEIEYLPTQVVKVESDYRFTSLETLEGTIKVTSPYTDNKVVTAGFTHTGNREEFKSDAKITCDCFDKPVVTEATFSSKNGIVSTFSMDSPFRGYETVNWNLHHQGQIDDFSTKAEYETNGKKITFENTFSAKDAIVYTLTFLTPFANISRTHLQFSHAGKFPNTKTHAEVAYNENSIISDFVLRNNGRKTVLRGSITTPFERYRDMKVEVLRTGLLDDFTTKAELKYDQTWHASLRHKFDGQDLFTSSVLKAPYLPDDVSLTLNHTGIPLNFQTSLEYTLGPAYKTSSQTKFSYNLPNLVASSKTETVIDRETRVNELTLEHRFKQTDTLHIDISSKLLAEIRDNKASADFRFKFNSDESEADTTSSTEILTYLIVEVPHDDFRYNKLFYNADRKTSIADRVNMESTATFTFETPLLEKASYNEETNLKQGKVNQMVTYSYGEYVLSTEQSWQRGKYYCKHEIPIEGYETTVIDVTYGGSLFDLSHMPSIPDLIDWNLDGTITQTALGSPIILSVKGNADKTTDKLNSVTNNVKAVYGSDKEVTVDFVYKPKKSVLKVTTPYEGYKSSELEANYLTSGYKRDYSISVTSSALETPVQMTSRFKLDPNHMKDSEIFQKFTSGFTNFTHIELHVEAKSEKFRLSWEDSKRIKKEIDIDGPKLVYEVNNDNVEAGVLMTVTTPFKELKDMKVNFDHRHYTSPMRAKEVILIQYNGKKYFDVDAEVGALNKFSGSIMFREPRQMEFSFSGVNEGQSVNGDLVLDWNKLEQDSNFRLQFGLADSGDQLKEKKVFHIRITNPERIISLHNNFEKTVDKISSSGKISWDEKEGKEMSYDLEYSKMLLRGSTLHSSDLKLTLPARSVEISSSYTNTASQIVSTGTVLWDSGNDRDKQVQVKVTLSPTEIRKMAEIDVKLPSMNKELSLSSEIAVNDGNRLLDGQTKLTYSPEVNKAVLVKYIIQQEDGDLPNYKAGWSLDHVYTRTHVEMMSSLATKDDVTSGDLEMKYRGTDKDMSALQLHSELDRKERKMNIKMTSPDQSAEITGHMTSESPYTVTIETSHNMKPTWKTVWTVDTNKRSVDASMTYDDFKGQVVTKAFFPNASSFVSETSTQTVADLVQEGRMSAELDDRKLHAHLKWRPELISEAATYGSEALQQMRNEISPVVQECMKDLGDILLKKHRLISSSLTEELKPVSDSLEEEMKSVQQDLRKMRRELKKIYRQNEFYLRTVEESYSGSVKAMLAGYSVAISKMNIAYTKAKETIEELTNKIDVYPFKERYNAMMKTISEKVKAGEVIVQEEMEIVFSVLTDKIEEFTTLYDDTIKDISNQIRTMIEVLLDELALEPYIDDVKAAYNKIVENYPGLDNSEILKVINEVQQLLLESMEKSTFIEKYKALYKRTGELLSEKFDDVMNNEDIQEMNKAILDLYEQVSWLYKYTEINISLRELIQKALDTIRSKVMDEFHVLPLGLLDLHKSKVITFDLENGEVEFDLYLPIPMDDFDAVMKLTADRYMRKMKALADKYFPRRDICLWDLYYRLPHVRWSMRKDLVPPFDVFGTVSGKQHFTTFDGHHLDVSGLCSYVLAQDVMNNNFSVVLKYTGGPKTLAKESIITMVAGKTVEMFQSYMVKVDGQPTELPYRSERLTIFRSGNTITLDSTIGLSVVSDFSSDYHIVGLSGWYYGKVGGLLGNNDNEPNNDVMSPEGESGLRIRKFLNSWEVASSCRSTMAYVQDEPKRKSEECAAVFNSSSSTLRPCFLQVLPDMYQHSCNIEPSALCDIATLYTETCDRHGVTVTLPNSCVKCQTHDSQEYNSEESVRYEQATTKQLQNSMDVVFVVEERQCNRDITAKLKNVIYRLEQSITKSGSSNNQYSLVGYAGSMVDSHTMEGQLFNDATKFAMGLENLRFNNLGPYTDPLSALKYASNLPFRTAVKKTVILVSCSPCSEAKGYSFSKLSSELQTLDISLHVLRQSGFQLKTNRSPKSQIFGVDIDEAYIGQKREDGDLFSDLDIPQDYCSSLALNSNGSIFDSGHLFVGSVRQQRRFIDSFSDRVQQKDSSCQICSCELDQSGTPRSVCRRCDRQPLYYKPFTNVVQKAVEYKNTFSQKIQSLLF